MSFHRHPSFFPVVLVLLTVLLGGFMVYTFRGRSAPPPEEPVVSQEDYRADVRAALAPVIVPDGSDRAGNVNRAIADLLALRVPGADTDAHLEFVSSLYRMREGLDGDPDALREGQVRFDAAVDAHPWVR